MNTVLTINRNDKSINFTHRNGEFRIVIKEKDKQVIFARLSNEEILKLKNDGEVENCLTTSLQHSLIITKTIIENQNRKLLLIHNNNTEILSFNNEDWKEITNYMYNGVEGKIIAN